MHRNANPPTFDFELVGDRVPDGHLPLHPRPLPACRGHDRRRRQRTSASVHRSPRTGVRRTAPPRAAWSASSWTRLPMTPADEVPEIALLTRQLERERRARRSAEDIGEAATADLWQAVRRLRGSRGRAAGRRRPAAVPPATRARDAAAAGPAVGDGARRTLRRVPARRHPMPGLLRRPERGRALDRTVARIRRRRGVPRPHRRLRRWPPWPPTTPNGTPPW